jgi:hypothetical protein
VAIAHQPVMAPTPVSTRPSRPQSRYRLAEVDTRSRASTAARIVGLVAATAFGVALATALVAGAALFALMTYAG